MKKFGIILLVLQVLAIFGTISSGASLGNSIPELIGYFLPGIVGVILLTKAAKKSKSEDK